MATNKDITKLPKWAQDEIARLRSDLAYTEKRLTAVTGERPTNIEVDSFGAMTGKQRKFLDNHSRLKFILKNGSEVHVSLSGDGKHIEIYGHGGAGALAVYPRAANSVHLKNEL